MIGMGVRLQHPVDRESLVARDAQNDVDRTGVRHAAARLDAPLPHRDAGLEARAISYAKGCYIGQEVIARIRTYGQVARTLRPLRLPPEAAAAKYSPLRRRHSRSRRRLRPSNPAAPCM